MYPTTVKKAVNPYSLIMFNFISKKILDYNIYSLGCPGEWGFGIATAPDNVLPEGFQGLLGHDDITSDNYGNYYAPDGSIMCWIPKFFYHCEGPIFHILDSLSFSNREMAKRNGYALHRAFVDGGIEVDGFFIDKYVNGASDVDVVPKIPYSAVPRYSFYNDNSNNLYRTFKSNWFKLTSSKGYYYQYLIRKRSNKFSSMSMFNLGALLMLMLAHGNASTSTENNAWYMEDPLKNHVKGPVATRPSSRSEENTEKATESQENNVVTEEKVASDAKGSDIEFRSDYNTVCDPNDLTIPFNTIEDIYTNRTFNDEYSNRMNHNGQYSGVNGLRTYGVIFTIGIIISEYGLDNNLYFLKESFKLTDVVFDDTEYTNDTSIAYPKNIDELNKFYTPIDLTLKNSVIGYYGNASFDVFSNDTEGDGWVTTGAFIPIKDCITSDSTSISQKYFADSYIDIDIRSAGFLGMSCENSNTYKSYFIRNNHLSKSCNIFRGVYYPHKA